jgi:hypothetical protein
LEQHKDQHLHGREALSAILVDGLASLRQVAGVADDAEKLRIIFGYLLVGPRPEMRVKGPGQFQPAGW